MIDYSRFVRGGDLNESTLSIMLGQDAMIDQIAYKVLNHDKPDYLMPITLTDFNNNITLKYKLVSGMVLKYRLFSGSIGRREFVPLFKKMIEPFINGKKWFLDYHYLCINPEFVYLSKNYDEVYYIYIPEASFKNSDQEIIAYFREIVQQIHIKDDSNLQVKLYQFFFGNGTLSELYALICDEEKGNIGATPGQMPNSQPAYNTPQYSGQVNVQQPVQQPIQQPIQQPVQQPGQMASNQASTTPSGLAGSQQAVKAGGLFDNKKSSTGAGKASTSGNGAAPSTNNGGASNASIMDQLFGPSKGTKLKKPEKQEKPKKEPKSGFGGLFGPKAQHTPSGQPNQEPPFAQPNQQPPFAQQNQEPPFAQQNQQPPFAQQNQQPPFAQQNQQPPFAQQSQQPPFAQQNQQAASAQMGYQGSYGPITVDSDETQISDGDVVRIPHLRLLSSDIPGAPENISLEMPVDRSFINFGRISNDPVKPDIIFAKDFASIGRMHLRIEKQGDKYIAKDLGSLNHTFINGIMMTPNEPYELTEGAEICFTQSHPVKYRVNL